MTTGHDYRTTAANLGPYALLILAGAVSLNPALGLGLGVNLATPLIIGSWRHCCRGIFGQQSPQTRPLQAALRQALEEALTCLKERWQETDEGRAELIAAGFRNTPSSELFARLTADLTTRVSETQLTALAADPTRLTQLEHAAPDAHATINAYFEDVLGSASNPRLRAFLRREFAPEVACQFNAILYGAGPQSDVVRDAFTILLQQATFTAVGSVSEEVARLSSLPAEERERQVRVSVLELLDQFDRLQAAIVDEGTTTRREMQAGFGALGTTVENLSETLVGELQERIASVHLHLDQLGLPPPQAPSGAPAHRVFEVPHLPNPHLVARDELLATLATDLMPAGAQPRIAALWGLGGVGKTQIAAAYAYRRAADTDIVWWLQADSAATIASDYAALARALVLPEATAQDQAETVEATVRWLEQTDRSWLLIFDNAERHDTLRPSLPGLGKGQLLITSTSPAWGALTPRRHKVEPLDTADAADFLQQRSGDTDRGAAMALGEILGGLPLALAQAAAYMETTGTSIAGYLELFTTHRLRVLEFSGAPADHRLTVSATWEVALQRVYEVVPAAVDLLTLCSFLAPQRIPLDLIAAHRNMLPAQLVEALGDGFAMTRTVGAIHAYSLVEVVDDRTITIHRLVQEVVGSRLRDDESAAWGTVAIEVVNAAFPFDSDAPAEWETCARLLTHAQAAADHAERLAVGLLATARLLNQMGLYLQARALFDQARERYERALAIGERVLGPDHPTVAIWLSNFAGVLQDQGDLAGAQKRYERALAIGERALGPDHPTVAIRASNLAGVLQDQGDLAGAQKRYERALAIMEATYEPDHPHVATAVNNFAGVLRAQGDLAGAQKRYERALAISEAVLGPDHPDVAIWLNNLAGVLQDQGDLAGAQKRYKRALAIGERVLGPDHPDVAIRLSNLAGVLRAQGDLAGAQKRYERALAIGERVFGPDHPDVAIWLSNFAGVLQDQGDLAGAQKRYERALAIGERALGPDHPTVAIRLNNFAGALRAQGDLAGAQKRYERALAIGERALGPDHPTVATWLNNLAAVLQDQGDLAGARERFERALAISEAVLGPDHPTVAIRLGNLGNVQQAQGDLTSAKPLLERALAIRQGRGEEQAALPLLHTLADIEIQLGDTLAAAARLRQAVELHRQDPPSYMEGISFYRLGHLAAKLGQPEAGLRLLAVCYIIDRLLEHPDAEKQDLPAVRSAATALDYDEARLQTLLSEVEDANRYDRGRGLVAAAFHALDSAAERANDPEDEAPSPA